VKIRGALVDRPLICKDRINQTVPWVSSLPKQRRRPILCVQSIDGPDGDCNPQDGQS